MFRNLHFQFRTFRNFNFSDCLGTIDPMPERALTRMIRLAYEESGPEPDLIDTLRLTLRAEIAERYLRQVRLPLTQRDFLLSKLFQFLYTPLVIQDQLDKPGALPLRVQLEGWLDRLSDKATLGLYRFDWYGFFDDTMRLDRPTLLENLDRYLPATRRRQRRRGPSAGRRGPVADVAAHRAVEQVIGAAGPDWTRRPQFREVAEALDDRQIPTPDKWAKLSPSATSWRSAVESHPKRVVKLLKYRLRYLHGLRRRVRAIKIAAKNN